MKEKDHDTTPEHSAWLEMVSDRWLGFGIAILSTLVLSGNLRNGFTNWDDPTYILNNYWIQNLSLSSLWEMVSHLSLNGTYLPLVQLSWALDFKLWGMNPFGFHLTNLLLHGCFVFLVYVFVRSLGLSSGHAVLTSLLVGIHPVNVEVVGWISARKDLLYGVLSLGALVAWIRYCHVSLYKYYWLSFILFLLAVLSKGSAVFIPLVLLLIDNYGGRKKPKQLILEKTPFWIVSIAFGVIAIYGQPETVMHNYLKDWNLFERVILLIYEVGIYLWRIALPIHLSPFYSFPIVVGSVLNSKVIVGAFITGLVLFFAFFKNNDRTNKFGFLFFLIMLFPYLKWFPIGQSFTADRYLYVSGIGIFLLLSSLLVRMFSLVSSKKWKEFGLVFVSMIFLILAILSNRQIQLWYNGFSLWTKVIKQFPLEQAGYLNLAEWYLNEGRRTEAWLQYQRALDLGIKKPELLNNVGYFLGNEKKYQDAENAYWDALFLDSTYASAYVNRGINLLAMGDTVNAMEQFDHLIRIHPDNPLGYINRGVLLEGLNQFESAVADYTKALELDRNNIVFLKYRAAALQTLGDFMGSMDDLNTVLKINPNYASALYWRSKCQAYFGNHEAAKTDLLAAKSLGFHVDDREFELLDSMFKIQHNPVVQ